MENLFVDTKYKIVKKLGDGAQGCVFMLIDENNNTFAIKNHNKIIAGLRESNILQILNHPNIIKYIDSFQHNDEYFIITEYINKGTLWELVSLNKNGLQEYMVRNIFISLLEGVKYIHNYGYIHRDLKLENIMIDSNNNIKIIDFGLCDTFHNCKNNYSKVGSIPYIAPEMHNGYGGGYECDIWSLGIILFELLFGYSPFKGDNVYEEVLSFPSKHKVSKEALHLIRMMLLYKKEKRYSIEKIENHPWVLNKTVSTRKLWKISHIHEHIKQSMRSSLFLSIKMNYL